MGLQCVCLQLQYLLKCCSPACVPGDPSHVARPCFGFQGFVTFPLSSAPAGTESRVVPVCAASRPWIS
jgi:hypothetical protein